ncbi:MAG: SDR family oxidoreductase [Balneolales bacterium]|nr:SDR family oxidoreductase [Balneolales bacterium]
MGNIANIEHSLTKLNGDTMKKIALFGATGQTGKLFLKIALEKGNAVNALVRNPEKVELKHPKLNIIKGDVLDSGDVDQTTEGCEIVVSLFGHVKGSPKWLQTNGTRNIVEAMKKSNTDKIISLSGGGLPYPEKDQPKFADKMIRFIMKVAVPKILNDAIEHHKVLSESGLVWSIVRAPRLTNDAPKGKYRVGWVGVNASTKIARADLAAFILKQVEDEQFHFQMPFVSY